MIPFAAIVGAALDTLMSKEREHLFEWSLRRYTRIRAYLILFFFGFTARNVNGCETIMMIFSGSTVVFASKCIRLISLI